MFYTIINNGVFSGGLLNNFERKNGIMSKKNSAKKKSKAGKVVAIFVALILIAGSACVVSYLVRRGQNAISNYATVPTAATEASDSHSVTEQDMPKLSCDDNSNGYIDGAVYIWQNKGFETFKGNVADAKAYAKSISNYKTALGKVKVYNAVVPTSTEITLPERLSKTFSNNQRENISTIIKSLSMDVTPVDVYNTLGQKRNENIYYGTDKYWTQLGAYYAYTDLAKALGKEPAELKSLKSVTPGNTFLGSHVKATVSKETTAGNPMLISNPDKVTYYSLPKGVTATALKKGDDSPAEIDYYNTETEDGSSPNDIYNTYDCAYTVLKNKDIKQGKIALVSDKFGYGIAPFLANNYNEVHIIDVDCFERNIKNYLEENKITEVVYLNGIMSANTAAKTAKTDAMF